MRALLFSLRFLTRFPIPGSHRAPARRRAGSLLWYPVVGGAIGAVFGWGARDVFSLFWPDVVSRILALVGLIAVKDAFHLDGLSDLVDGLHGGGRPDEIHRIMKDPHTGAMGVVAIVVAIGIEAVVVVSLPAARLASALAVCVCVGTTAAVGVLCGCPPLREKEGLGASLSSSEPWRAAAAFGIAAVVSVGFASGVGLAVWGGGLVATGVYCIWLRRRLGGASGDVCGAAIIGIQILSLLLYQALLASPLPVDPVWGWLG